MPETIETIGRAAFFSCTGLKEPIVLTKNLREISDMAFGYYPLSQIQFPPRLEIINGAFKSAKLKHIALPESVKEIGYEAFCHTLIESVEIPNGVTILNSSAFDDCSYLRQVSIGAGVQDSFKYGGFRGCSDLENICVSLENEYLCDLDGVLFDKAITRLIKYPAKKSGKTYIVPETVTNICSKAFEYARVKKVICPAGLKQISDEAFYGSSLKHINIPNGIECVEITHRFRDDEWDCFPKGVFYKISSDHPRYEKINGNLARKRIASTPGYTPP